MKPVCRSQFQHKLVNLFFILVMINDKWTDLWGNRLLQKDVINTFCETEVVANGVDDANGVAGNCRVVHLNWIAEAGIVASNSVLTPSSRVDWKTLAQQ